MIDICVTYNEEFTKLKNICINSLGHHQKLNLLENKISTQGDIGFGTNSWYTSLRQKIKFVLQILKTSQNDIVCLSDIDILYCDTYKLIDDINNFKNTNYNLAACCEFLSDYSKPRIKYKYINSGFIIFKKNELNISLLESVLNIDFSNFKFGDQDAINFILKEKKISSYYLNPEKYILQCQIKLLDQTKISQCVLFHANCTNNLRQKMNRLRQFRRYYLNHE